jgi:class 3 adenylate cyclase
VLTSELYALVADDHPDARHERVEVRGRDQPVDVVVLSR